MERYNRHIILKDIGSEGQSKLNSARVLVIGAGGLGCPVLQYLAAAGIGTLGIVDYDVVDISNLQRQILFGNSSLGLNKALAAKERLQDLNSDIIIEAYPEMLTPENATQLFEKYDIIVDGTDNFATRYLINDTALLTGKPVVFGAIYKFEGQVSVFNYKNGPSYRCLFPKPPKAGSVASCSEVGVLGVLPGIIGSMQANEVIKVILGFDNILSGKLYCYNAKTTQTTTFTIPRSNIQIQKVLDSKNNIEADYAALDCKTGVPEISVEALAALGPVQFIDIREPYETPKLSYPDLKQIPLRDLEQHRDKIDPNKQAILFCQSGVRSRQGVALLQKHHIKNIYSLKEGAQQLSEYFKSV